MKNNKVDLGLNVKIGRIKAKIPKIGRIDARGVLTGCQDKTKVKKK